MEINFCINCGKKINPDNLNCKCGFVIDDKLKQEILENVNSNSLVNTHLKNETEKIYETLLDNYELKKKYLLPRNARKAYEKKKEFIHFEVIPKLDNWKNSVEQADKKIAKEKVNLYNDIVEITEFILKDFFGPFAISSSDAQEFRELRDFSKHSVSKTIVENNLDFREFNLSESLLKNKEFLNTVDKLSKNIKLNNSSGNSIVSLNSNGNKLNASDAAVLINVLTEFVSSNQNAIKEIRLADQELVKQTESISNIIKSLKIHENEIEKERKVLNKCKLILEHNKKYLLNPIVESLNNNEIFRQYKNQRLPYEKQQEIVKLDKELVNNEIEVSFWKCLFRNKDINYKTSTKERLQRSNSESKYTNLLNSINYEGHKNLENSIEFENQSINSFKEFEKIQRRNLKQIAPINNNKKTIIQFATILKQIKQETTN